MPRFYHPNYLFEVARRTNRGEDLFDANDSGQVSAIVGIIAEAQHRYGVQIYHIHFMSNHYHGLFRARTPRHLARFFNFVHGEIAKLINRNRQHPGVVWSSKFTPLAVTTDPKTLLARMKYLTGQALCAQLVTHPSQFPGVSAVDWLLFGVPMAGRNGDQSPADSDQGPEQAENPSASRDNPDQRAKEVTIAKLPCFEHRSWAELHAMYAALADEQAGLPPRLHGHDAPPTKMSIAASMPGADRGLAGDLAADDEFSAQMAAADGSGDDDAERGTSSEARVAAEVFDETAAAWTSPRHSPAKVQVPNGRNEDDGTPLVRGPVQPKGEAGKKRRGKLRILTFSAAARSLYFDDLRDFCRDYNKAMAKLQRHLDSCPTGVRLRGRIVFPPHSLLPGCLAPH